MAKNTSDWLVYDLDNDMIPSNMGHYDVRINGVPQQAFWYGGGWWSSISDEDAGDISVDMWSPSSFVAVPKVDNWQDKSLIPNSPGEYEVCIDAPWPLGGPSKATWNGVSWTCDGDKTILITQWRVSDLSA